ncbi:SDR family oxidoreductase [Pseudomonas sp. Marseille-QA0892]
MQHILIAGASRGIGLALAQGFLKRGDHVTVVVRKPGNEALDRLASEHTGRLEQIISDLRADDAATKIAAGVGHDLDVILLNAGVSGPKEIDSATVEEITDLFMTNTVAPIRIARAIQHRLKADGILAFTSSQMGSVALARSASMPLYGASKAALNSLLQSWTHSDDAPQATVLALHPGWVRTDMGGDSAPVTVEQSAAGLIQTLDAYHGRGGCHFVDFEQQPLAW